MTTPEQHQTACVDAFVLPRFRARLHAKPSQFLHELHHDLPAKLDPCVVVPLPAMTRDVRPLTALIAKVAGTREESAPLSECRAVYLGSWSGLEVGEYALLDALAMAEDGGAALVSVLPGELAYYATEQNESRWLLCGSEAVKKRAAMTLKQGL